MSTRASHIPVNNFGDEHDTGVSIERADLKYLHDYKGMEQPERHDRHTFHLLEEGSMVIEIDFKKHKINAPSVTYMHPSQVHRIVSFKDVVVSTWAITNMHLNAEYLQLLEDLVPARPLSLSDLTFSILYDAVSLGIKLAERSQYKLGHALLKDGCNTLAALVLSQYLEATKAADMHSRFGLVTQAFRRLLEHNYTTIKRPVQYAHLLNISVPYLNECVKHTTGLPVSYHIQQRIILEAKRLLYHSGKSVKEIAAQLGYDDYPYFSRLFTKATGVSALSFRNKNHD